MNEKKQQVRQGEEAICVDQIGWFVAQVMRNLLQAIKRRVKSQVLEADQSVEDLCKVVKKLIEAIDYRQQSSAQMNVVMPALLKLIVDRLGNSVSANDTLLTYLFSTVNDLMIFSEAKRAFIDAQGCKVLLQVPTSFFYVTDECSDIVKAIIQICREVMPQGGLNRRICQEVAAFNTTHTSAMSAFNLRGEIQQGLPYRLAIVLTVSAVLCLALAVTFYVLGSTWEVYPENNVTGATRLGTLATIAGTIATVSGVIFSFYSYRFIRSVCISLNDIRNKEFQVKNYVDLHGGNRNNMDIFSRDSRKLREAVLAEVTVATIK